MPYLQQRVAKLGALALPRVDAQLSDFARQRVARPVPRFAVVYDRGRGSRGGAGRRRRAGGEARGGRTSIVVAAGIGMRIVGVGVAACRGEPRGREGDDVCRGEGAACARAARGPLEEGGVRGALARGARGLFVGGGGLVEGGESVCRGDEGLAERGGGLRGGRGGGVGGGLHGWDSWGAGWGCGLGMEVEGLEAGGRNREQGWWWLGAVVGRGGGGGGAVGANSWLM